MGIQFNSTSAKSFRNVMSKYYAGVHENNDSFLMISKNCKNYKEIISNDKALIERLLRGDSKGIVTSLEELVKEVDSLSAKVDVMTKPLEKTSEKLAKAKEECYKLVPDDLCTNWSAKSLVGWFATFGVVANETDEVIVSIVTKIGTNATKERGKKLAKNGIISVENVRKFKKDLVGIISDIMVENKVINPYKYSDDTLALLTKKKAKKSEENK